MFTILLVVQILVSISIISLVMLQQGKGADMGAAFGSGASGTVFGSQGSSSFFTRATAILAAVFFINCLIIASPLVRKSASNVPESVAEQLEQQAVMEQKAAEQEQVVETLEQLEAQPDVPADLPEVAEPAAPAPAEVPEVPAAPPSAEDLPE